MKIIGLCGGSGSGKGMVSAVFEEFGIPSIDTDQVYREITSYRSECMEALILAFGKKVVNTDGSLNREEMRKLVFSSEGSNERRRILNDITHKFVLAETDRRIDKYQCNGKKAVIADVPLLFESGFDKKCDIIIVVIADMETRIARIMNRDGITQDQARARIMTQITSEELIKKSNFVIENNGSIDMLKESVKKMLSKLEL